MLRSRIGLICLAATCGLVVAACATTQGDMHAAPSEDSTGESPLKPVTNDDSTSLTYVLVAVTLPADVPATSVYVSERGARAILGHDAWVRLYLHSEKLWAGSIPVVGDEPTFVASFRIDGAAVADTRWCDDRVVARGHAVALDNLKSWDQRDGIQWHWIAHLVQLDIRAYLRQDARLLRVTIEAPDYQTGSNFASDAVALGNGIWVSSIASWVTPESPDDLSVETIRVFANLVYAPSDGKGETIEESTPMLNARVMATSWQLEPK